MTDSREFQPAVFGLVDIEAEHGLFSIDTVAGGTCRLTLVARTERGYPRRELAAIPGAIWKQVASSALRELLRDMDPEEHGPKPPSFKAGENALSPLIVRELAVLLWALMEDGEGTHTDALLAGWRQLAREERWWLYARASNPTQRQGQGWRRALYFALTDPADTRTAPRLMEIMEAASAQKKNIQTFAARQLPGQPPEGAGGEAAAGESVVSAEVRPAAAESREKNRRKGPGKNEPPDAASQLDLF